jgi:hypothetical protein
MRCVVNTTVLVESCGELVQKDDLGIVDQRQGYEEPLLLSSGQGHEPRVALLSKTELLEKALAGERGRVERAPEMHRLPDLDPFLKLGFLELHSDPIVQTMGVTTGVERQDGDRATLGRAKPLDALHRRRLASPVGSDQPKDLASRHVERHIVDGDRRAVGLSNARDVNDRIGLRLGHDTVVMSECAMC